MKIVNVDNKFVYYVFLLCVFPDHPSDARYIWLPIQFENGIPVVEWIDSWTLDYFD